MFHHSNNKEYNEHNWQGQEKDCANANLGNTTVYERELILILFWINIGWFVIGEQWLGEINGIIEWKRKCDVSITSLSLERPNNADIKSGYLCHHETCFLVYKNLIHGVWSQKVLVHGKLISVIYSWSCFVQRILNYLDFSSLRRALVFVSRNICISL